MLLFYNEKQGQFFILKVHTHSIITKKNASRLTRKVFPPAGPRKDPVFLRGGKQLGWPRAPSAVSPVAAPGTVTVSWTFHRRQVAAEEDFPLSPWPSPLSAEGASASGCDGPRAPLTGCLLSSRSLRISPTGSRWTGGHSESCCMRCWPGR